MDRVTARNEEGKAYYPRCFEKPCYGEGECKDKFCRQQEKICETIAAYEETGIPPEAVRKYKVFEDELISTNITFGHLVRLINAEYRGVLLRLPVAKDGILYEAIEDCIGGNYTQEITVQEVSDSRIWANDCVFDYDELGRTVFLTKEEAEAALAKMKEGALND